MYIPSLAVTGPRIGGRKQPMWWVEPVLGGLHFGEILHWGPGPAAFSQGCMGGASFSVSLGNLLTVPGAPRGGVDLCFPQGVLSGPRIPVPLALTPARAGGPPARQQRCL